MSALQKTLNKPLTQQLNESLYLSLQPDIKEQENPVNKSNASFTSMKQINHTHYC